MKLLNDEASEEILTWYKRETERLTEKYKELNRDVVGTENITVYPIEVPENYYSEEMESDIDFKIEELLMACNLYFIKLNQGDIGERPQKFLDKYEEILHVLIKGSEFVSTGAYKRGYDSITVTSFPENYFENSDIEVPDGLKALVQIISNTSTEDFETTLMHESTHAFLDQVSDSKDNFDNQKFNAIDEAAARAVSLAYRGEIKSPTSEYGKRFDTDIMQTVQIELVEVMKESDSTERQISNIRNKAAALQKKALRNPERDITQIINEVFDSDRSVEEIKNIRSILYLFEDIEHKMFDFLMQYGFVDLDKQVYSDKLDKQIEDIDSELSKSAELMRIEKKQMLMEELEEKMNDEQQFVELMKKFGPLPNRNLQRHEIRKLNDEDFMEEEVDFHEIRRKFMEYRNLDKKKYLEFLNKLNEFEQKIRKGEVYGFRPEEKVFNDYKPGDYEEDLKDIAEEIQTNLKVVRTHIEKERNLIMSTRSINEEVAEELDTVEAKNLVGPKNRLDPQALLEEKKELKNIFLKSMESYHQIIRKFRKLNGRLMESFEQIFGEIKVEKKETEKELREGKRIVQSTEIEDTQKAQDVRKYLQKSHLMDEEEKEIFEEVKDLYRIVKIAEMRAEESQGILNQIETKVEKI